MPDEPEDTRGWIARGDPDEATEAVVEALRERVGEHLRAVFYGDFREREYHVLHASTAVVEQYSAEDVEAIADDVALEWVAEARQGDLYEPIGELEVTVRVFERGINVVAWGRGEDPTVFVGLDGDASALPATVDVLREFVRGT
jgi:hypothetical protein